MLGFAWNPTASEVNVFKLTATQLHRFINCPGSDRLESFVSDVDKDTKPKDEGIAAHWLVQQVYETGQPAEVFIDRKAENDYYITAEMVDNTHDYLKFMENHPNGECEADTSWTISHDWVIAGRADYLHYNPEPQVLTIPDFKYGWGIVEPEHNWTLLSHAIAWIYKNPDKPVKSVSLAIYQPRPYHPKGKVRYWNITIDKVIEYTNMIIDSMNNRCSTLRSGHLCINCSKITGCPAANSAQMNAIDVCEEAYRDDISDENLSKQLNLLDRALDIIKERKKTYEELATDRIRKGRTISNYSVSRSLGNTVWQSHVTPEVAQIITGMDLSRKELITPTQAKKAGVNEEILEALTERPDRGFKLVRIDENTKASKMFEGLN